MSQAQASNVGEEFLQQRASCIGGTDASAILGVNPWRTRHEVWLEKAGLSEQRVSTDNMETGLDMEPILAQRFVKEMQQRGKSVRIAPAPFVRLPEYPFLGGHPDGLILNGGTSPIAVVEYKTTEVFNRAQWGEPGSDEVPQHYLVQCQHYLMLTGLPLCYLYVWIGFGDKRIFEIPRHERLIAHIKNECIEFWQSYVVPQVPPPVDESEGAQKMLRRVYATDDGSLKESDGTIDPVVERLFRLRKAQKRLEEKERGCANRIQEYMGAAQKLTGPGFAITWSTTKDSEKTDWKAVAEDLFSRLNKFEPVDVFDEIVGRHTETKPGYRQFRPMEKKAK